MFQNVDVCLFEFFNCIDLVKNAIMSVNRLHKMREDLTTRQFEKYYKNRN